MKTQLALVVFAAFTSSLFAGNVDFKSAKYEELNPDGPLSRETGTLTVDKKTIKASWVYRGPKGKPTTKLSAYLTLAGYAKTHASAVKACEALAPAGEWRLVSDSEAIIFGSNYLLALPQPASPDLLMHPYWAAPDRDDKPVPENSDVFLMAVGGRGATPELIPYAEWRKNGEAALKKAKDKAVIARLKKILDSTKNGVPVICLLGTTEH